MRRRFSLDGLNEMVGFHNDFFLFSGFRDFLSSGFNAGLGG